MTGGASKSSLPSLIPKAILENVLTWWSGEGEAPTSLSADEAEEEELEAGAGGGARGLATPTPSSAAPAPRSPSSRSGKPPSLQIREKKYIKSCLMVGDKESE